MVKCRCVSSDPEIMHGTPVFSGTRVPVQTLFDYIEAGHPLSEFFEDFPSVMLISKWINNKKTN